MVQYKKNNAVKRTKDNGMFLLAVLLSALLPAMLVLLVTGCRNAIGVLGGPVTATVTYYLNGGTNGTAPVDSNTYSPGDVVTVENAPTATAPTGAEAFFGWSTSKDGFGRFYAAGSSFTITKDTELYALWNGDGSTAANSKLVSTADALKGIGVEGYFALVDDVTMTAPVTASPFTGTFDGRGHTVTLNMNVTEGRTGLFKQIGDGSTPAMIKNVYLDGSITVTGTGVTSIDVGGIAAYGTGATITNCVSSVMISASHIKRLYVGGIVGMVGGTENTITNCYVSGSISTNVPGSATDNHAVGGIVGDIGFLDNDITVTIQKTVSLADITWTDYRSYAAATQAARRIVGFKGTTGTVSGTIANNYALGTVTMTANTQPVSTQAANADYDGTAITTTDAADETWWKDIWSDVWGGNSPTPAKPWTWDADAQRPKLYRVE